MTALKKDIKRYSQIAFTALLSIGFILKGVTGVDLDSISAYYYEHPALFSFLLTLAGISFIQSGSLFKKHRFDIVIGLALFGVIFTPCFNESVLFWGITVRHLHFFFAIMVFEGSVFNMIYFSSGRYRFYMILLGLLMNLIIFGSVWLNWYNLFWLEIFGMVVMSFHKNLEISEKID